MECISLVTCSPPLVIIYTRNKWGGVCLHIYALDIALAAIGVLVGLSCDSPALKAAAVFSVADLFSEVRPRKEGLGDDYSSLGVAAFVVWAGVSLVLEGLRQPVAQTPVHPYALVVALIMLVTKGALTYIPLAKAEKWLKGHYIGDAFALGLVLVAYLSAAWCRVHLEPGVVVIIGVLVLSEAVELVSEAVQEISSYLRR